MNDTSTANSSGDAAAKASRLVHWKRALLRERRVVKPPSLRSSAQNWQSLPHSFRHLSELGTRTFEQNSQDSLVLLGLRQGYRSEGSRLQWRVHGVSKSGYRKLAVGHWGGAEAMWQALLV